MAQLEGERVSLKQERAELFDRLHQQDIACTRAEAHLAAAQGELNAHASQAQRVQEAVAQLNAQLGQVEQSLQDTQGQEEGEDEQRAQRQARILDLSREISLLRGQVAQMQKETGDGRVALTACGRDLEALTANRERLSRQKSDTAQLLLDSEQALAQRQEQLEQFGSQLAEDEKNLARFKDELNRAGARSSGGGQADSRPAVLARGWAAVGFGAGSGGGAGGQGPSRGNSAQPLGGRVQADDRPGVGGLRAQLRGRAALPGTRISA